MGSAVLVTGWAGDIGSHAVLALVDRAQPVVVLDDLSTGHTRKIPKGVPFVRAEVADADLVRTDFGQYIVPESENGGGAGVRLPGPAGALGRSPVQYSGTLETIGDAAG